MWSKEDIEKEMVGKMAPLLESEEAKEMREQINRPLQETDPKLFSELLAIVKENPTDSNP